MKYLLAILLATTITYACLPPLQPLPPLGCDYDNAVLVHHGEQCYWVYMDCGL